MTSSSSQPRHRAPRGGPFGAAAIAVLGITLCATAMAASGSKKEEPVPVMPPLPELGHFRVLWMHDPSEKAVVSWTTPAEGSSHVLHFDTQPRAGRAAAYARRAEALPPKKYTKVAADAATPDGWAHHVLLENLKPATTYYFVVASDGRVSREFHFLTAPADSRTVKVLYGGDSRRPPSLPEPHLNRRAINRLIASLVEQQPDIMALAHGGDYCSKTEWRFMTDWLSDHELTITKAGRILPIIPARGNHDGQLGFEEVFFWPARKHPFTYTTALSARAAMITLNTQISRAGDQRDWLEAELTRLRAQPGRQLVVQYHVPAYPSVKSFENGAQQRQHWVPLFEQHQVDLVCEADDHMLKRTVPIFQEKVDFERGVVYIGDGGLGVPQRVPDTKRWYLQPPGFAKPVHHVQLIEFAADAVNVTAIGLQHDILDQVAIKPKPALATAGQ